MNRASGSVSRSPKVPHFSDKAEECSIIGDVKLLPGSAGDMVCEHIEQTSRCSLHFFNSAVLLTAISISKVFAAYGSSATAVGRADAFGTEWEEVWYAVGLADN